MQITSVRYRELLSLRGCEHKALEATVGLGDGRSRLVPDGCCITVRFFFET